MQKLLTTYANTRTAKSRVALLAYLRKHPMAECMVTPEQADLIADARDDARQDYDALRA